MNCMRGPFNVDDSDVESSVSSNLSAPDVHSQSDESHNDDSKVEGNVGELEQMKLFAAVETARVNRWKLFVIITILVVGGAVSTFTYITLSTEQSNDAFSAVRLNNDMKKCDFQFQLPGTSLPFFCSNVVSFICQHHQGFIHIPCQGDF